jgi:hypothetical protein
MTQPQRASDVQYFPYGYPGGVCYIEQKGEHLTQCRTRPEIREAVARVRAGDSQLFAAWPGQYRTDLFLIDDIEALAAKVGA